MTGSARVLLAIESATSRLSVALRLADGRILERAPDGPGQHAESILPLIDGLLADAGIGPDEPTELAVSIGPGSFTSLRVGLATAKGLAFATRRRIVPVPTLEVLAFGARRPGDTRPIAALLDARRGDLYAALFAPRADGLQTREGDGLFTPEELAARLPDGCRVVGEGAAVFAHALGASLPSGLCVEDAEATRWPRARSVAEIAAALPVGESAALAGSQDLAPRYVRRAEAEAKRVERAVEDPSCP